MSFDGDKTIIPDGANHGRSRRTAHWLNVAVWQLPDLREQRADCTPGLLDWMLRARPGDVGRGGGKQYQWPDGRWRTKRPPYDSLDLEAVAA